MYLILDRLYPKSFAIRVYASSALISRWSGLACSPYRNPLPGMTIRPSFLFLLIFFAINAVEWVNANPFSDTTTIRTRFTSRNNPTASIRFVKDSGVCETTPGVHQISGYLDVGKNMSMVSIFFPSEHRWSLISASVVLVL